jgi:septal ring-binding cell division protein DamX
MPGELQSVAEVSPSERRSHPREQALCSIVDLDNDNGGIVLNISERGLAIQAVRALSEEPLQRVRLELPQSRAWIETRGRIVWMGASKKTVGVEFVGLSQEGEARIKSWVSSIARRAAAEERKALAGTPAAMRPPSRPNVEGLASVLYTDLMAVTHKGESRPVAIETAKTTVAGKREDKIQSGPLSDGKQYDRDMAGRGRTARWVTGLAVLTVLCAILGFLAPRWQTSGQNRQVNEPAVVAKSDPQPSPARAYAPKPSAAVPRAGDQVFLQVGAMAHKDNATRLAASLSTRGFQAFVSHRGADRLFRVLVGPYGASQSARTVREELRKLNVAAILVRGSTILGEGASEPTGQ